MPVQKPQIPPAAEPRFGRTFDPWNSVSTGHQRAETQGPQGWRASRNMKLQSQFAAGNRGGRRIADAVGAGSEDFDPAHKVLIPKDVRVRAMHSVVDMLRRPGTMNSRPPASTATSGEPVVQDGGKGIGDGLAVEKRRMAARKTQDEEAEARKQQEGRKMFDGLCIYVNGSTHPLVSDHRLKQLLSENGAKTSIHLGRRQVTHVILGKPSGPTGGGGGGLAGGKLEREIRRGRGCGIKYVGVEWVLESIKAGKRLPEARFANLKVAANGQQSVLSAFSKAELKIATMQEAASPSTFASGQVLKPE